MRLILLTFCLALAASAPAQAQTDTSVAGDLSRLRQHLHLTAGQEAAWRVYASAMAPNGQTEARRRETMRLMPTLTTPRRVALVQAAMAQDAADVKRQSAAVLAFYDQLTPEQQQVFDKDTLPATSP